MQSSTPAARGHAARYGNGVAWVGPAMGGSSALAKAVRSVQAFVHQLSVLRRARTGRYDIVQSKDDFLGALLALAGARASGARFVYWLSFPFPEDWLRSVQEGDARYPWVNRMRGRLSGCLLYRVLLPAADFVFVQSEQMREDVATQGIPRDKLFPVPMGIEEWMLDGDAVPARQPTLAYLGTMVRTRRIDFVLDVFARVLRCVPEARLLMVGGEGEDVDRLRRHARELGVADRVVFTGSVPRDEALAYVRQAHVCLSPFYPTPVLDSTSPTKLMEYFALGRAVVANQHPEQSRVLAASGGGLCVPYEVEAFAEAAVSLLRDPQRAAAMGRRGREYARARSYRHIARSVVAQYQGRLAST
jgi:glycosyltransferase involved in cell wall biosynthesis